MQCYLKPALFRALPSRVFLPTPGLDIRRSKVFLTNRRRVHSAFKPRLAIPLALEGALEPCKFYKDLAYRSILEVFGGITLDFDWDCPNAAT